MATDLSVAGSFPYTIPDGDALELYEVVGGRIVENPPMGAQESVLAGHLTALMAPMALANRLGRVTPETLFLIDRADKLKRRPDVAFVSDRRWPLKRRIPQTEAWDVIPDLAVEIVSETNSANSVVVKIEEYFQAGVGRVWVIYPVVGKVYIYDSPTRIRVLQLGDDLDGEGLIPGFRVALKDLFEGIGVDPDEGAAADDRRGD
jgi:Uma2 family endonuclease